jgi:hypothetical protein
VGDVSFGTLFFSELALFTICGNAENMIGGLLLTSCITKLDRRLTA